MDAGRRKLLFGSVIGSFALAAGGRAPWLAESVEPTLPPAGNYLDAWSHKLARIARVACDPSTWPGCRYALITSDGERVLMPRMTAEAFQSMNGQRREVGVKFRVPSVQFDAGPTFVAVEFIDDQGCILNHTEIGSVPANGGTISLDERTTRVTVQA